MKNYHGSSFTSKVFWLSVGSIFYTYFIYPALIWLLAAFRPKSKSYLPYFPNITLLIAAHNEEAVIGEKLKNCLDFKYPLECLQILVVADGSTDQTMQIVQNFPRENIQLLYEAERRGKMAAINRAMQYAQGDVIVFSDANNFYQPETIKDLIAPFQDPKVGAVSGAKVILQEDGNLGASEGLYWKYESFIKEQESRVGSCTGVSGEILAVRKNLYQKPPDEIINDDFYIAMRIICQGYRLVYVPTAKSYERVSPSAMDEVKRRQRIIAGRFQAITRARDLLPLQNPVVVWQVISHKFMRPLVPFAMILAFLGNLGALFKPAQKDKRKKSSFSSLEYPYNFLVFLTQILFYGLAWLGIRFENQERKGKLTKILYLPTFLINSNLAALKGFIQYLRGQQTTLWERIPRR